VISPNVRGSAGYGKSYLKLDNGVLREDSVKDIGALLDWIGTQPDLDADRVIVYGGSYGGYMVLASLVHFDERAAGRRQRGGHQQLRDLPGEHRVLPARPAPRGIRRRARPGDAAVPREHLAAEQCGRITSPLFVAQGYNDPRVPYTESEQIVQAVRANDVAVWYLLAMDEGHGFAKKANRDYFQAATVMFFRDLFGQLLVLEIARFAIQRRPRKGQRGAEKARVHQREQQGEQGPGCAVLPRAQDGPPENTGGDEKAAVLEDVPPRILERKHVEDRQVPEPDDGAVQVGRP
jgi:dienelactone hydrolase